MQHGTHLQPTQPKLYHQASLTIAESADILLSLLSSSSSAEESIMGLRSTALRNDCGIIYRQKRITAIRQNGESTTTGIPK